MKALILAGGYSKRLWPITRELPKSFLEFGGKPVLDHIMEKIEAAGQVDEVIVSTNKKFEYFFVHWMNTSNYNTPIKLVVEPTVENEKKLGAIGAINYVIDQTGLNEDFILIAGDNLFECDLSEFIKYFKSQAKPTLAVNDIKSSERILKYGVVTVNQDNKIVSFVEKPAHSDVTTVCIGLYAFTQNEIGLLKRYIEEGNNPDATGFLLEWMIKNGQDIRGWLFDAPWFDIGTHSSFDEAKKYYQDMKGTVLVTGGVGYIGHHVVDELLKEGFNVKVMDSLLYGFEPDDRYDFIRGDTRNESDVRRAMEGVDYVIHLAALSNDPSVEVSPDKGIEINYNGTKLTAQIAKKMGVKRFIFPSSCSVYGNTSEDIIAEHGKVGPLTLYAHTKLASEEYLKSLVDEKFDVCSFRFGTLFGDSKNMRFDLVANIVPVEATEGQIKLFGGSQSRPMLHVHDAARALVAGLKHPIPCRGEAFNVGSPSQNYTIRELTELIQKNIFPDITIKEFPENVDARSYQVDFTKIQNFFGYETKTGIVKGVAVMADKLKAKEYGNPRDDKYFRVKFLINRKVVL